MLENLHSYFLFYDILLQYPRDVAHMINNVKGEPFNEETF